MTFNINEIRSSLVHGGWRPSHFQVIINNPFDTSADQKIPFMCRAAQIPSGNVGSIPVYYFGRAINVPGDRTIEQWTVTVINDEDFKIRNTMEAWQGKLNSMQGNIASTNIVNEMKSEGNITAYGKDGRILRQYTVSGLFPINVSAMEGDWSAVDTISEFQVTFAMDDFRVSSGVTGIGAEL